jgi:tRNA-splicing ligase RtcB
MNFQVMHGKSGLVKHWTAGVEFEEEAQKQVLNVADLPFIFKHVAVMPDTHAGLGATIGSVIPTMGAVIPAACGVDIGCGISCVKLDGVATKDLVKNAGYLREKIEHVVPHGRTANGGVGDVGAHKAIPEAVENCWKSELVEGYNDMVYVDPELAHKGVLSQLGTLGTGNHFFELSTDENDGVWAIVHSGSRGIGNKIGQTFINKAKAAMQTWHITLADPNLAYLPTGTLDFAAYMRAVEWAQRYARLSRELMMRAAVQALGLRGSGHIDCHHNFVAWEQHFGKSILVTRKGAVRARVGDKGIIPGSMGARSYIVEGLGNPESFMSCSHGAGRRMSRTEAKRTFSLEDHAKATAGVDCRQDADVLDETPGAYKSIDSVMAAQADLVKIKHTLKAFLCIKG